MKDFGLIYWMNLPLGLLINFGAPLLKDRLKRVVNQHTHFASSRLRVHQHLEGKEGASQVQLS
jgi:hypothetical protein